MNYSIIAGPAIGAVIGYGTNYIAVKMLFRPLKPVRIGKFTLPFTPGIIPKGKDRLGKALGKAVGGTLITEEELVKTMLSEEMKQKVGYEVKAIIQKNLDNQKEVGELLSEYLGQTEYESKKEAVSSVIADKLVEKAINLSVGTMIANEAVKAVKEKVKGTLLAMMVNDQLLSSFIEPISTGIDDYIKNNGVELLEPQVRSELDHVANKTIGDAATYLNTSDLPIEEIVVKIYENFIHSRLRSILEQIDIESMVERKINEMDVLELEELVLSVMKKELNAVVNLGALIGFLLGLFNLLF